MNTDITAPKNSLPQKTPQAVDAWEIKPAAPHLLPLPVKETPDGNFSINLFSSSNNAEFQQAAASVFAHLQWDLYDVRRRHIQIIEESGIAISESERKILLAYYKGDLELDALNPLWLYKLQVDSNYRHRMDSTPKAGYAASCLPTSAGTTLSVPEILLRPTRKKACTTFAVNLEASIWSVRKQTADNITQKVGDYDYRAIPRKYDPIPQLIVEHQAFQRIFSNVLYLVKQADPDAGSLLMTAWMMSCYAWPDLTTTNSPEGIHQDGADYIVSALVIERKNIKGGTSRVFYGDNHQEPVAEVILQEGQGIFMSDAGSPLFHDLTHMHIADSGQEFGVRNILGFDIYLN
jgi:hypothetical protein